MVLTKKTPATRVTLLTTRRPWASTWGRAPKSESSRTTWATCRAASLPLAMAMLQSAWRRASRSLTPSPVMATVRPAFCRAWTSCFFWAGETRPKTAYSLAARSTSASVVRLLMSMYRSAWGKPA